MNPRMHKAHLAEFFEQNVNMCLWQIHAVDWINTQQQNYREIKWVQRIPSVENGTKSQSSSKSPH